LLHHFPPKTAGDAKAIYMCFNAIIESGEVSERVVGRADRIVAQLPQKRSFVGVLGDDFDYHSVRHTLASRLTASKTTTQDR
jgi:hypothetical protein